MPYLLWPTWQECEVSQSEACSASILILLLKAINLPAQYEESEKDVCDFVQEVGINGEFGANDDEKLARLQENIGEVMQKEDESSDSVEPAKRSHTKNTSS